MPTTRFTLGSDEFAELIGPKTAAVLGRPWARSPTRSSSIREGQIASALASRDTWSGIIVPGRSMARDERLPVEMSGLPVFDRDRNSRGYRGFGVCRDVARLADAGRADARAARRTPDREPARQGAAVSTSCRSAAAAPNRRRR